MRFNPYKKFETLKANVDSVIAIKKIMTTGIEDHHFLQNLFELSEALSGIQRGKTQFDWLIADKTMSSLYEEMWRPDPIDLVKLSKLPEGSLGKIFADNLLSEGFDPKELTEMDPYPIKNFKEYALHRSWETHDIAHTLCGFNVDALGELAVQAFMFSNCRQPMHIAIIFGGLFKGSALDPTQFHVLSDAITYGLELGNKCSSIIYTKKFEEGWGRPISEWREELNLPQKCREAYYMRKTDYV